MPNAVELEHPDAFRSHHNLKHTLHYYSHPVQTRSQTRMRRNTNGQSSRCFTAGKHSFTKPLLLLTRSLQSVLHSLFGVGRFHIFHLVVAGICRLEQVLEALTGALPPRHGADFIMAANLNKYIKRCRSDFKQTNKQ